MKNLTFILLLFSTSFLFSQNKLDIAWLKSSYSYTYLKDTVKKAQNEDLLILQIGKNISKCYSYYTFQSDSLRSSKDGERIWHQLFKKAIVDAKGEIPSSGFPYKRMRTCVYKNYPQEKMTITDGISIQDYIYEDTLNAQIWQIRDSVKTILGYSCQKAECNFRGRHWIAWFASDIPVSDGPWKFSGLPGLIMEVYDRGKQHHFTITGLQKVKDEPIVFSPTSVGNKKFEKASRKTFLKAERNYLMDINGRIELETGINFGNDDPQKKVQYDLIERDYK